MKFIVKLEPTEIWTIAFGDSTSHPNTIKLFAYQISHIHSILRPQLVGIEREVVTCGPM